MRRMRAFGLTALVVLAASPPGVWGAQSPQVPLAGKAIPQFVQSLSTLSVQPGGTMTTVVGNQPLTLRMCEFKANVLPPGAVLGYAGTWVWGYLVDTAGGSTCSQLVAQYGNAQGIVDTYIGPVIVNDRGTATPITYVNDLGSAATTNVLAYKYSTDQTLHWADPLANQTMANECMMKAAMKLFTDANGFPVDYPPPGDPCAQNYGGPVAAVPHLHGGEVPAEIDGSPDSWFTSDGLHIGHKYYSAGPAGNSVLYKYPNTQEASPIWFHDHTLGATRLNVYAGLAGAYFIEDPAIVPVGNATTRGTLGTCAAGSGCLPANLQPVAQIVPLVLQDRMFDATGQLFFPSDTAAGLVWALNPEHPYWVPEFVGDTIVVNGKAWPFVNVEARRYRFLFLNGSNARTYEMALLNQATGAVGPPMWVIGTDGGYLDTPVKLDPALGQKLTIMPGERYEVIIDFAGFPNTNLVIKNSGRTPYPKGAPPQGSTLGRILQFRVGAAPAVADSSYNPATLAPLRSGANTIVRLTAGGVPPVAPARTRALTLNEVMGMPMTVPDPVTGLLTAYPGGPLEILVNNTKWSGVEHGATPRADFTGVSVNGVTTYLSEMPQEGDTEVWEVVNLTADAHPIHLHLVQFQLINRQNFNTNNYNKAYSAAFPTKLFQPGFGPPLNYNPSLASGRKFGGNPDTAPFLQGPVNLPLPQEQGWKDTVIMYPGQVTRIAVRWAPTSFSKTTPPAGLFFPFDPSGTTAGLPYQYNYVWHCHIIDHEDNEMMRPDAVVPSQSAVRTVIRGTDY
ncbi:MAG: multicopper oxidase domain-containing protein [Deltaproteobacteria bacterium]|nr:multicopper oxidase domain-containing protein [Deltaproteobacteria bacterium]